MKFNGDQMSWTVICTDANGSVMIYHSGGSHDKYITWDAMSKKYGSRVNPVNGYYVLTIVPGTHPVYAYKNAGDETISELYK